MYDDALMDHLLRDAMAVAPPQLSRDFDAKVMRAVRPRRLTHTGRLVLGGYAIAATGVMAWAMGGLPLWIIGAALAGCAGIAAGSGAYVRKLAEIG